MADLFDDELPEDLRGVDSQLRAARAEWSPLELDRVKSTARAQARRSAPGRDRYPKGRKMQSRLAVAAVTLLLLGGTTAGGIAWGGGGDDHGGSAACSQYKPGHGYGDKNHVHYGPPGQGNRNPCDQDDQGGKGDKGKHGNGHGDEGNGNHGNGHGDQGKNKHDKDNGDHGHGHGHGH